MKIFTIIIISLFSLINLFIGRYYTAAFSLTGNARISFWIVHILATASMLCAPIIYRLYPEKNPSFSYSALQWTGYTFMGIYSVLIIFILLNSIGLDLYHRFFASPENLNEDRRLFFKSSLALISLLVTGTMAGIGLYQARQKPIVKKIDVKIDHLPDDFEGVTILQLSDVHVGQTIRREFVETLVEMSNQLNPDIVVLTGDMVDGTRDQLDHEIVSFKKIKAPLGKFMIPGNHEYYWGVDTWLERWRELGFTTLINQHSLINKNNSQIIMAGVHDYSASRMGPVQSNPVEALEQSPKGLVKILLAHQPRSVYQAAKAGFDLQLSGHTHSGQYFPYNIVIYLFQPFVKGLHLYEKTWIYVNQGTGYWGPPTRFGVPPEITLLTLTKKSKPGPVS